MFEPLALAILEFGLNSIHVDVHVHVQKCEMENLSSVSKITSLHDCTCAFVSNAGHLVLSANGSLFVELMDHLLAELKQNASHSTTRTFIQCIGAIW